MARTTVQAVEGILLDNYGPDEDGVSPSLTPFIEAANSLVSRVATCATTRGITLSAAELELIERWLAAHFYSVSDRPLQEEKTLDAFGKFQGKTDMGLNSSYFGQTAKDVDPSGCLASLTSRKRITMNWLGKAKSDQIDYRDRD